MIQSDNQMDLSIKKIQSLIIVTQKSIDEFPSMNQILADSGIKSQRQDLERMSMKDCLSTDWMVEKQSKETKITKKTDKTLKLIKCKAKMLETLQKHPQLKKKYQVLLVNQSEKRTQMCSNISNKEETEKNKIKFLNYKEVNTNEIVKCSSSIKEHQPAVVRPRSMAFFPIMKVSPMMLSLYNGSHYQNFYILKLLGEGISGKVYLVMSLNNRIIYSVKMIKKPALTTKNSKQIIREIKIQALVNHPNIVKLYHFMVDKQFIYLFLEPCLEGDLKQNVKNSNGRLCEREVKNVIRQVSNSVEYMHQNGIIHRNIRPQNILFHQGNVKLCDFGWATYSPLLKEARNEIQLYFPRNQRRQQQTDRKDDTWNIGILTYELLFGTGPFQIRNFDKLRKKPQQQIYFPGQINISDSAKQFILGCLHKEPNKRFDIRQARESQFLSGSYKYRWTVI